MDQEYSQYFVLAPLDFTGDTWKCGWDIAYRSKPKDLSSGVFDQQSVGSNPSRGTCVLKQNA